MGRSPSRTPSPGRPRSPGDSRYRRYDWRPKGCDGKSKPRDRRDMCSPAEAQVCNTSPAECIVPAGLPCYGPRWPPRSQSPCSAHLDSCRCVGTSSRPPSPRSANPCDYRLCSASETFAERVQSPHTSMCAESANQRNLLRRPRSPVSTICAIQGPARKPDMDPAGIITKNPEYPYPAELHTIIRLDSSLKHHGMYKFLGQIKGPPFWAKPGDIMILKVPRAHLSKDNGYVAVYTQRHNEQRFKLCPGDLLLRLGKFVDGNVWRYKRRYKLYQLTDELRWLLMGMVDNFVDLLPLTTHVHGKVNIDRHCRFFVPRRGDLIVQLRIEDSASKLAWFSPRTKDSLRKGDIVVRAYLGSLQNAQGAVVSEVEAQVEIYMYTGVGLSWIYMGRDDCWLKDGRDILPIPGNAA